MKTLFSILILLCLCELAPASDRFNTLIWNRKNHDRQNQKIDKDDWFEWWYYKVVDPQTNESFFFTYGVINPWDLEGKSKESFAVLQAGDFEHKIFSEKKFAVRDFAASYDDTYVKVGENIATDKLIKGHIISDDGHEISWDLSIEKDWSFNAMGWGMEKPYVSNIFWYPAQASAFMTGWIQYDKKFVKFERAPAYQDRNWGQSFPKWWTWLASNNFKNSPGTVLAAGGGKPKALNKFSVFNGLCIGLRHQGKEYAFRTTDGDKIKFDIKWGTWEVQAQNSRKQKIEISAYAPPEKFLLLPFHSPQGKDFYDYEALTGNIKVRLFEKQSGKWQLVANLDSDQGGIEWGSPDPITFEQLFNQSVSLQ